MDGVPVSQIVALGAGGVGALALGAGSKTAAAAAFTVSLVAVTYSLVEGDDGKGERNGKGSRDRKGATEKVEWEAPDESQGEVLDSRSKLKVVYERRRGRGERKRVGKVDEEEEEEEEEEENKGEWNAGGLYRYIRPVSASKSASTPSPAPPSFSEKLESEMRSRFGEPDWASYSDARTRLQSLMAEEHNSSGNRDPAYVLLSSTATNPTLRDVAVI